MAKEIETGALNPIEIIDNLATIAVVGEPMKHRLGIAGKLFSVLGRNGVNVIASAQGAQEMNISLVVEMVQSGEIQKEEMRTHPNKNIITRALGTDDTVRPDCFEVKVEPGDVLLLCSDGLTNMVEDSQIEKIVKENKEDMKLAGEKLVQQANEAGGKDNISVILVRL